MSRKRKPVGLKNDSTKKKNGLEFGKSWHW